MKYGQVVKAIAVLVLGAAGSAYGQNRADQEDRTLVLARPRVGLVVDVRPRPTDSIGAFVEEVSPGSPAAKAGIRPSDIIIRFDGQAVASTGEEPAGSRLISLVVRRKPTNSVPVEIRRGTRTRTVTVSFAIKPSPLTALKTVPLNSQLGRYFGTAQGLLVLEGIDDDRLPLQGGDVIVRVNGDTVHHPAYLEQLLRRARESAKLDVIRRRRQIVVTFQP